MIKSTFNFIN